MRAALLARVSTAEQADEGRHSLPAQLEAMRARCAREGWTVVREFVAPGESAATHELMRRPVLAEMVQAAEAGEFDVLVFHESSRLARDEELAHWLINRMERFGVRLVNASKDVDYHDAEGRFLFAIDAGLDAYWSRKVSAHVRKGKRQAFLEGRPVGSLPFGYERDADGEVRIVEVEAEAVRWAFEERSRGMGPTEVAREFNRRGLRPRSRLGYGQFTVTGVQAILENDFYAGWVRHRGERRQGIHPAIVSEELWHEAQSARHRTSPRAWRGDGGLLVGVVWCADCGGPVWSSGGGYGEWRQPYYREASVLQLRECAQAGANWRCSEPDAQVAEVVRSMGLDEDWLAAAVESARVMRDGVDAAQERNRLEAERQRVTNAYIAGVLGEPQWRWQLARIERELGRLPSAPLTVMSGALELRNFAGLWDQMLLKERRDAVKAVFARVTLEMGRKRVWLTPRDGYGELFEHRATVVDLGTERAGVRFYNSAPAYPVEALIRGAAS